MYYIYRAITRHYQLEVSKRVAGVYFLLLLAAISLVVAVLLHTADSFLIATKDKLNWNSMWRFKQIIFAVAGVVASVAGDGKALHFLCAHSRKVVICWWSESVVGMI